MMRTDEILQLSAETRHVLTKTEERLDQLTSLGCEKPSVLGEIAEPTALFREQLDTYRAELDRIAEARGLSVIY